MRYEKLLELNDVMKYFKEKFPSTPEDVMQDFIYPAYKHAPDQIEPEVIDWLNDLQWIKQEIFITLDMFDYFTKHRIQQLLNDPAEDNDRFRHQRNQIISTNAVSKKPIILTINDGKYELQEGWHRTVEALRKWPDGYKQIAWIGK